MWIILKFYKVLMIFRASCTKQNWKVLVDLPAMGVKLLTTAEDKHKAITGRADVLQQIKQPAMKMLQSRHRDHQQLK